MLYKVTVNPDLARVYLNMNCKLDAEVETAFIDILVEMMQHYNPHDLCRILCAGESIIDEEKRTECILPLPTTLPPPPPKRKRCCYCGCNPTCDCGRCC